MNIDNLVKGLDTLKEIELVLRKTWNLGTPTQQELNSWKYKEVLTISTSWLLDKELIWKTRKVKSFKKVETVIWKTGSGKITKIEYEPFLKIYVGEEIVSCSGSYVRVKMLNPLSEKEEYISLDLLEHGKGIWSSGYYLDGNKLKSIYYKTKEYRTKLEDKLNKKYNTTGLKAPIQAKECKEKISSTMKERYGVQWFLNRGEHYKTITNIMKEKYNVENVFYSNEWQEYVYQMKNGVSKAKFREKEKLEREQAFFRKRQGVSKTELEVVDTLLTLYSFKDPRYCSLTNSQVTIVNPATKQFFRPDFYDKETNIIVEIYGDYWHCNPKFYEKDFSHKRMGLTAQQVWDFDRNRQQTLINATGAKFIVIWASEWADQKDKVIEYLKSELPIK